MESNSVNVKNVMQGNDVRLEGDVVVVEGAGGRVEHTSETARQWLENVRARQADYADEAAYQAELNRAQKAVDLLEEAR